MLACLPTVSVTDAEYIRPALRSEVQSVVKFRTLDYTVSVTDAEYIRPALRSEVQSVVKSRT